MSRMFLLRLGAVGSMLAVGLQFLLSPFPVSADTLQGTGTASACVKSWTLWGGSVTNVASMRIDYTLTLYGDPTVWWAGWAVNNQVLQEGAFSQGGYYWRSKVGASSTAFQLGLTNAVTQRRSVILQNGSNVPMQYKGLVPGYAADSCVVISNVKVSRIFYDPSGVTPPPGGGGVSLPPTPAATPTPPPPTPTPLATPPTNDWVCVTNPTTGFQQCYPPPPDGFCYSDAFLAGLVSPIGGGHLVPCDTATPAPTPTATVGPPTTCAASSSSNPIVVTGTYAEDASTLTMSGSGWTEQYSAAICYFYIGPRASGWWYSPGQARSGASGSNECSPRVDINGSNHWGGAYDNWWGGCGNGTNVPYNEPQFEAVTTGTLIKLYSVFRSGGGSVNVKWTISMGWGTAYGTPPPGGGGVPTPSPSPTAGPTASPEGPPTLPPCYWGGNCSPPPIIGPTWGPIDICPSPRPSPEIAACVKVGESSAPYATVDPSGALAAFQGVYDHLMSKAPFGYVGQAAELLEGAVSDPGNDYTGGEDCFGCLNMPVWRPDDAGGAYEVEANLPLTDMTGDLGWLRNILKMLLLLFVAVALIRWAVRATGTSSGDGA